MLPCSLLKVFPSNVVITLCVFIWGHNRCSADILILFPLEKLETEVKHYKCKEYQVLMVVWILY